MQQTAHRYKFNDEKKRRKALLDATYHYRFVNHDKLHMTEESFNSMIEELCNAGYLKCNNSNNHYGANQYDTTMAYEQLKNQSKRQMSKEIADTIASMAGHFVGAYMSELKP
jgi:ABC-type branched-subunit amino acid transport system substrate-binding protein